MNPFDNPDITILTNDRDAGWVAWELSHAAEDNGDTSFEVSEKLERSYTAQQIHEIWIVVNDLLKSGELLLGLYVAFKALKPREGRRITLKFGARLDVSRDDRNRFESLGVDLAFERSEESEHVMSAEVERQWQLWVTENLHTIPGLSEADAFDAEIARLREQVERDLAELMPQIEEELGDLDDLLRSAYESIHDPDLGFKD